MATGAGLGSASVIEQPDGPVFLIAITYPEPPTRILAVCLGFVLPVAACRLGSRIPGTAQAKTAFTIVAGAAVALTVRWRAFSYYEPNSAFVSWLLGLTAVLVAAAALGTRRKADRSKEGSRELLDS